MRALIPSLCLGVVLGSTSHAATLSGLRLETVDTSRCRDGSLVLYVTDIEIDGVLSDRPESRYRLVIDGKPLSERPSAARRFADTKRPVFLALVIEASLAYAADLEQISLAASSFIQSLPSRSRITLVTYSGETEGLHSQRTPRQALVLLQDLAPHDSVDLSLIDALNVALKDLARVPATERRMIVLLSDGINRDPSWDLFRSLGSRARRLGLPIAPIGYSPIDERGPLLNLGELAKRSLGTFRWAKTAADISQQLQNLGQEISGQCVLSFPVDRADCDRPLRVQVAIDGQRSNEVIASPTKSAAKSEHVPWLAVAGLIVVVAALGFVTWLLVGGNKRKKARR